MVKRVKRMVLGGLLVTILWLLKPFIITHTQGTLSLEGTLERQNKLVD